GMNAERVEHGLGIRTGDGDDGEAVESRLDLDLVHDDVAAQDGNEPLPLGEVDLKNEALRPVEDVQIAQNVALGIQNKGINPLVRGEITHVIGDHSIQPATPVSPGERNQRAVGFVDSARGCKRRKFGETFSSLRSRLALFTQNRHIYSDYSEAVWVARTA